MNILFVTDLYPIKNDKTIPNTIKDFVLALKSYGNNITIIRPNLILNSLIRKHKIIKNGLYNIDGIKIYNKNFLLPFINLNTNFLKEKYDIIISHMPSGNIYASKINKNLNLAHIIILHQSDYTVLNDLKYKLCFKKQLQETLNSATIIGARNSFLKNKLNAEFVLPSFIEKNFIIDNKIFKNKKLKIITLSKLIKRKNIDKVILALSKANFDFEYNIYGEGIEKNKLNNLIKKYNLQNKIKLNGFIEHNEIINKLDENDIFILPSINETFGISYLEAMARGLIVIGTKNTGIDGIIKNNVNGFLIDPNQEDILKILEKINNININEISKQAIIKAKELEKTKVIEEYIKVIKHTIENFKKSKNLY